ncbi:MAG: radical SAM protein [Desulfobacterales bacterium]|nr:radical SAM protein [Desulfobacterales bacterium]
MKKILITALAANQKGEIFEIDGYAATGMAGSKIVPLTLDNTVELPFGSELMLLPDRIPVYFNISNKRVEKLSNNPFDSSSILLPVAAFNSPGYLIRYSSSYQERENAGYLPLFAYSAVGFYNGKFRSAVVQIDKEKRQDLRLMPQKKIANGLKKMKEKMKGNRLILHLEKCAMFYGCPAAKNLFIGRFEAPLPTSTVCNANCLGCISLQKNTGISHCQERIIFTPTPDEISEIALEHIHNVKQSVVSFGQGCEGEPLMAADAIAGAIDIIRSNTNFGTINMNTNGSKPDIIAKLFEKGLDSIRVSMNSVREEYYNAYFRPKTYTFNDVKKSIEIAIQKGKFVSINYLNCPGFTDTEGELEAMLEFIKKYPINFIQWRNLNFDPLRYINVMENVHKLGTSIGMKRILKSIKKADNKIRFGYFNPPKEKW